MAKRVQYITTRPVIPEYDQDSIIVTGIPHLYLRPLRTSDLHDYHELRSQHEVMKYTSQGRADADLAATRTWLGRFIQLEQEIVDVIQGEESGVTVGVVDDGVNGNAMAAAALPPDPNPGPSLHVGQRKKGFNFSLVYDDPELRPSTGNNINESSQGKVIGSIGCHSTFPETEFGYMIRQEYWRRGFASAATKAYLEMWWSLKRESVPITEPENLAHGEDEGEKKTKSTAVDTGAQDPATTVLSGKDTKEDGVEEAVAASQTSDRQDEEGEVTTVMLPESLKAEIEESNLGSAKVLGKLGFTYESDRVIPENGKLVRLEIFYIRKQMSVDP